ncbi:hypothetical protein FF011L_50550 [Roseimaritima multifibrata]|uniref:Carboxypeptidase regulatory-like domain-containing protein n=1 Tax=Roseimaritima multifibrata TaxID=1930274 RepID=A0A517MN89_9BACT|nr:hypothetical protein [Roseimaritima multifibrata]QDS96247.1 hypothetical protein FF011L_50550 [Roseimaritima multifibrata]
MKWMSLILGVTLMCLGCSDPGLSLVPASGTLVYKEKPLAGYEVILQPADGQERRARGLTDEQGRFQLGTVGDADGAMVGKFTAFVVRPVQDPGGEPGRENFSAMKPEKSVLPAKYASPETSGLTVEIPAAGTTDLKIEI